MVIESGIYEQFHNGSSLTSNQLERIPDHIVCMIS